MNAAQLSATLSETSAHGLSMAGMPFLSGHRPWAAIHRSLPLVLLVLLITLLCWCFSPVFAGEPAGSDNSFHYGELVRLTAAIRAGDWNWWNPSGNSGFASGYYYQVLPQALPALLAAVTGLSPLVCFQLGIFVPLVLVPAAAYRAVRIAGGTSWQAMGAALAVPFAVGSSRWGHGADGTFTVGLYTQAWALAAFPLALAHSTNWLERKSGLASALAWGVFVGLCHPFAGVALGLALLAGVLWSEIRDRRLSDEWSRLMVLGGLLLLGSACAWLPVLVDYDGFGGFPHRAADEIGPGFIELARWFVEGQMLDEGRAICVLTALLPLVFCLARTRWLPRLWAAGAAFALLLGLGPHLPKIGDDILSPVRFIGPLQILLAMCVGIGVAALVERSRQLPPDERRRRAMRWCAPVAAVMVALLATTTGARLLHSRVKVATDLPGIERDQLDFVMNAMISAPPGRLQVYGGAAHHWSMMLPYVTAGRAANVVMGGAALQSSPTYAYHRNLTDPVRAAWVFDAPLVLGRPGELQVGEVLKATNAYELRLLPAPGLVSPVQVVGELPAGRFAARAAGLSWLTSELPLENKVLAHHGSGATGFAPRGRTLLVARSNSNIRAEVEAEAATTFIVRESWHPRWRASLDGISVPIRRVTPDYLAIDVPAARHKLELHFERPLWTWLLWMLWPGLTTAAWAFEKRQADFQSVSSPINAAC